MNDKRYLVTGSAGFLGSYVSALLRSSSPAVRIMGIDPEGQLPINLLERGRLSALLANYRPTHIIHCAGRTTGSWDQLYMANVCATEALLETCAALRLEVNIVVVSSAAVYGRRLPVDCPLHEMVPLAPVGDYAVSKAEQERLCHSYAASARMCVTIARVFNVLGPGQPDHLFPAALLIRLSQVWGEPLVVDHAEAVRDYIDVRDVAGALRLLADLADLPPVCNVATGTGVTVGQLARMVLDDWGGGIEQIDGIPAAANDNSIGDVSVLTALGWKPIYSLEQSIFDMIAGRRPSPC